MSISDFAVTGDELPEGLQSIEEMDVVEQIIEYQNADADFSVILSENGRTQQIRVPYLKSLREDWEWIGGSDKGRGFVLLKQRGKR